MQHSLSILNPSCYLHATRSVFSNSLHKRDNGCCMVIMTMQPQLPSRWSTIQHVTGRGKLLSLLFDVGVLLLITTGTPHSVTHMCMRSLRNHTRHARTHALWVICSQTRSLSRNIIIHMHVTTIFHSVHYCNLNNSYTTAYH